MMLPSFMIRQVVKSQDSLLHKFLIDSPYVSKVAQHESHACIGEWAKPLNGKLLELGCGPGKYVALLNTLGFEVIGVDPLEFPTWQLIRDQSSADLRSGIFADTLPFSDGYFDHAACLGALLYFEQPEIALGELHRVLKPGGRLILRTVNKSNFYTRTTGKKLDPASRNLYDMDELEALVSRAGFKIEKTFSYGFWPPILANLWWYLVCVWLPLGLQDLLSKATKSRYRVNNIIFATRI
jgi:SAM-dependent methyltransferase